MLIPQNIATLVGRYYDPKFYPKENEEHSTLSFTVGSPKASKRNQSKGNLDYFQITCFGKLAIETYERYKEGSLVEVVGIPQVETYKRKDGTDATDKKIKAIKVFKASAPFETTNEQGEKLTYWVEKYTNISTFTGKFYNPNFYKSEDGKRDVLRFSLGSPKAMPSCNKDNKLDFFQISAYGDEATEIYNTLKVGDSFQLVSIPYNDSFINDKGKRVETYFKAIYVKKLNKPAFNNEDYAVSDNSELEPITFEGIEVETLDA